MTFNREVWLQEVATEYRRDFRRLGLRLPPVHISVGHTGQGRTIGVTYARSYSRDGRNQIFVSPTLTDTAQVIKVTGHELVHAMLDCQGGHGRDFQLIARQLGFTKSYQCSISGPVLDERIKEIVSKVGKYKHPGFAASSSPIRCQMR